MEVGDLELLLNVTPRQGFQEAQELPENVFGLKTSPCQLKHCVSWILFLEHKMFYSQLSKVLSLQYFVDF